MLSYDRIVVMDGGRVVESGAPAELLQRSCGRFTQLVRAASLTGRAAAQVAALTPTSRA